MSWHIRSIPGAACRATPPPAASTVARSTWPAQKVAKAALSALEAASSSGSDGSRALPTVRVRVRARVRV